MTKQWIRPWIILAALLVPSLASAEDMRQMASLTSQAREVLRQEMLDNLMALNEILGLLSENRIKEAGEIAESRLGRGAMGKHARLPFESRPGPQMPSAMHDLGRSGHMAASEFARAAASGDKDRALKHLSTLTGTCVACHAAFRTR